MELISLLLMVLLSLREITFTAAMYTPSRNDITYRSGRSTTSSSYTTNRLQTFTYSSIYNSINQDHPKSYHQQQSVSYGSSNSYNTNKNNKNNYNSNNNIENSNNNSSNNNYNNNNYSNNNYNNKNAYPSQYRASTSYPNYQKTSYDSVYTTKYNSSEDTPDDRTIFNDAPFVRRPDQRPDLGIPLFAGEGGVVTDSALLKVHKSLQQLIVESDDELIPRWVQLGFHTCMGGCDGCLDLTIDENKGLNGTYTQLKDFHQNISDVISLADLVALAATEAANKGMVKAGGRQLASFRIGRVTCDNPDQPDKMLEYPKGSDPHALEILMEEFNLQRYEAVALLGTHSLGRCRKERLGFQGPWDNSPLVLNSAYYASVIGFMKSVPTPSGHSHQWIGEQEEGPDDVGRMMLHADQIIASNFTVSGPDHTPNCNLTRCPPGQECDEGTVCPASSDKQQALLYRNHQGIFHRDFIIAFTKMLEKSDQRLADPE